MTSKSYPRGWPIVYRDGVWVYEDTGKPVDTKRPCRRCGRVPTAEGHDACLGTIEGLVSACCGHGVDPSYTRPWLKCWHCDTVVQIQGDGWTCPNCSMNGSSFKRPAHNKKEGHKQNAPYLSTIPPIQGSVELSILNRTAHLQTELFELKQQLIGK